MIRFDGLLGKLKLGAVPDKLCWGDPASFLKVIQNLFNVEFPSRPQDKFTIVGPNTPTPDQTTQIWERTNKQGEYVGKHLFIKGQWRRVYDLPLNGRLLLEGIPPAPFFDGLTVTEEDILIKGKTYYAVKWVGY